MIDFEKIKDFFTGYKAERAALNKAIEERDDTIAEKDKEIERLTSQLKEIEKLVDEATNDKTSAARKPKKAR